MEWRRILRVLSQSALNHSDGIYIELWKLLYFEKKSWQLRIV